MSYSPIHQHNPEGKLAGGGEGGEGRGGGRVGGGGEL
jgi:hypothetical protein